MYRIKQEEPEGWEKAHVIYFGDRRITHCRYKDTAAQVIQTMIGTHGKSHLDHEKTMSPTPVAVQPEHERTKSMRPRTEIASTVFTIQSVKLLAGVNEYTRSRANDLLLTSTEENTPARNSLLTKKGITIKAVPKKVMTKLTDYICDAEVSELLTDIAIETKDTYLYGKWDDMFYTIAAHQTGDLSIVLRFTHKKVN